MSKMPVLFVGHGSPMNAIEDNQFSRSWKEIARKIPKPEAIMSVSAHWYTRGTKINNEENPKTIYDMDGFPRPLYEIVYDCPGSPTVAKVVKALVTKDSEYDNTWGIDHGTWSVLVHMYPDRDIPVLQLSVDRNAPPEVHYMIGKELGALRNHNVLIFCSGNIVHNLRMVDWNMENKGYDWAYEFDDYIHDNIMDANHDRIMLYHQAGECAKYSVPIPDHYYPLLYALGASSRNDEVSVYNKACVLGSVTMTSYLWE